MENRQFAVFILTHGRPDNVITVGALRKAGYTGKVYIVIDDEDKTESQYRAIYGDDVLQFSKTKIAAEFDEADNFNDRRSIFYARNACFDLARQVGCTHFVQLDDDYTSFMYRFNENGLYGSWKINLDWLFPAMCDYLDATPFSSIAMSQGGDHIGGGVNTYNRSIGARRKAMNSFVCRTDRQFKFVGRVNEDVNTYTCEQRKGTLFLTLMMPMLTQRRTQSNAGGMTEMYLDSGTYIKSFYSIMFAPSCVKIAAMGVVEKRLHHNVDWDLTAPKIISQDYKKQ